MLVELHVTLLQKDYRIPSDLMSGESHAGRRKGLLLDIKGKDTTFRPHQPGEKKGVVSVSGSINHGLARFHHRAHGFMGLLGHPHADQTTPPAPARPNPPRFPCPR